MNCPACGAPLEARAFDDRTEVDFCPSCFGVWYDLADLAVSLDLAEGRAGTRRCPRDGAGMMSGRLEGSKVEADRCLTCGGFWLDAGEVNKLRAELGVDKLVGEKGAAAAPPLPASGASKARPAEPIAGPLGERERRRRRAQSGDRDAQPRDSGRETNNDAYAAPVLYKDGRTYRHFQTSWPKVTYVLGEFPWEAKVGDEARTRDFIHPPYLLSQEKSGSDLTWSHGEYLEPSEVWAGFGLGGEPPGRRAAAPAQPNPHDDSWSFLKVWGSLAAAAAVGLFTLLAMSAQNAVVFQQDYAVDLAVPERSFVTPEFDLGGSRPSSVRVDLNTNLSNSWAFLRLSLINAETGTATHFEREVSYYWGSDDGESWSEGGRDDTVYLSRVPPGRYYLHVDPEAERSFGFTLRVTRDAPRLLHLTLALLALLLPFGWTYARHHVFEVGRWAESDHPMTSSEDDDE